MTDLTIPEFLPKLRSGTGATPQDGGCLIQVAGYLWDGKSWVDDTPCVHPVLRRVAITVNDSVSDEARPRLAPLAADLVGTGPGPEGLEGRVLNVRLAVWAAKRVQHLVREKDRQVCADAVAAAEKWVGEPTKENANAAYAAANAAANANAAYAANAAANAANAANAAAYATNAAYAAAYAANAAANAADAAANAAANAAERRRAADDAYISLLVDLIAEHKRLTGHQPTERHEQRWQQVCDALGAVRI